MLFKRQVGKELQRYAEELAKLNDEKRKTIRLLQEILKNKRAREELRRILSEQEPAR